MELRVEPLSAHRRRLGIWANATDCEHDPEGAPAMNMTSPEKKLVAPKVFSRVLVGVDGSEESREAARQAATLAEGELTLLAVYDIASALVGGTGFGVPVYYDEDSQRDSAKAALQQAQNDVKAANATGKVVRGVVWDALIHQAERGEDTLIAVGSRGVGRMAGIVMGSVATEMIHKAPCSVLVARKRSDVFPHKIVVGIDGSPQSLAAYAVAKQLAERFETELVPVRAHGGKQVEGHLVDRLVGPYREDLPDEPVTALVAASADADLLVVGSRGLHGIKALGSVSERVAHQARCSVLIVREPSSHPTDEEGHS
jgi:nucleotide-binding universal stress UspA family protein